MRVLADVDFTRVSDTDPYNYADIDGARPINNCPSWQSSFTPYYHAGTRWVMQTAPQYLGGYDTSGWPAPQFASPRSLNGPADSPLFVCRVNVNVFHVRTAFAHGPQGQIKEDVTGVHPKDLGCQGTPVGFLDGSAALVEAAELKGYQDSGYAGNRYYLPEP